MSMQPLSLPSGSRHASLHFAKKFGLYLFIAVHSDYQSCLLRTMASLMIPWPPTIMIGLTAFSPGVPTFSNSATQMMMTNSQSIIELDPNNGKLSKTSRETGTRNGHLISRRSTTENATHQKVDIFQN